MDHIQNKWPKKIAELTEEQKKIKDDFMYYWHEILPQKYGIIEWFNHNYPKWRFRRQVSKRRYWNTLEIGGGRGSHVPFEKKFINQSYTILELRDYMLEDVYRKYPNVKGIIGDCQVGFGENCYDRIIAIHVLEHLPNLPAALDNMKRSLRGGGVIHIVIPCEGSLAYTLCRKISAERIFKKRYHMPYDWFIKSEHINTASEIMEEIVKRFDVVSKVYFPTFLPFEFCNIVIGMELKIKD